MTEVYDVNFIEIHQIVEIGQDLKTQGVPKQIRLFSLRPKEANDLSPISLYPFKNSFLDRTPSKNK